jgi:hypothetical protein
LNIAPRSSTDSSERQHAFRWTDTKIDGPLGFFLTDEIGAAECYALRRGAGGVLEYTLSRGAVEQLEAAGATFGPTPPGGMFFLGNELAVPPGAFELFDELRAAGEITVRGL